MATANVDFFHDVFVGEASNSSNYTVGEAISVPVKTYLDGLRMNKNDPGYLYAVDIAIWRKSDQVLIASRSFAQAGYPAGFHTWLFTSPILLEPNIEYVVGLRPNANLTNTYRFQNQPAAHDHTTGGITARRTEQNTRGSSGNTALQFPTLNTSSFFYELKLGLVLTSLPSQTHQMVM